MQITPPPYLCSSGSTESSIYIFICRKVTTTHAQGFYFGKCVPAVQFVQSVRFVRFVRCVQCVHTVQSVHINISEGIEW